MKFLRTLLLLCGLLQGFSSTAQTAILTDIGDYSSGRLVTITTNRDVTGYLFFYKLHDKDTNYYVRLFDENLQVVGNTTFAAGKAVGISRALYESGRLMLLCTERVKAETYRQQVRVLKLDSSVATVYDYAPDAADLRKESNIAFKNGDAYLGYYTNVEGLGFLGTYDLSFSKGGMVAVMLSLDGKEQWRQKITDPHYGYLSGRLLTATPQVAVYYLVTKQNRTSHDGETSLLGLNPQTGAEIFRQPMAGGGEAWDPEFVKTLDDGRILICNNLTDEDQKLTDARQTGFNYGILNIQTGRLENLRTIHYATDLGNEVEMKNSTKSREGFLHLENMLLLPDSSAVIVGEFYKRTVNGGGLALAIIGAPFGVIGDTYSQGTINDFFMMRLSPDGKVEKVQRIDHKPFRVRVQTGTSIGMLSRYLENTGAFHYHHTDDTDPARKKIVLLGNTGGDGMAATLVSIDKDGYKKKTLYSAEKFKATPMALYKAKPGYVLLMKQGAKGKGMTMELMATE